MQIPMSALWISLVGVLALSSANAQDFIFATESSEPLSQESNRNCFTSANEPGKCIPLNSCQPLKQLMDKIPLTSRDRDYLQRSQCGYQGGEVLVCCPVGSTAASTSQRSGTDSVDGASLLPAPGKCGTGNFDKVVGGKKTKIDEFPWMALLNYDKPAGRKGFHCGGVLINNRYVLTASHCVNGLAVPSDWSLSSVRLGEWDTRNVTDCEDGDCNQPPLDIPIEELIPHESYEPASTSKVHDIALLRLSRPVNYTEWIKPICLPIDQHLRSATFEGISLDVAGWGRTETGSRSNVKLKATVKGTNLNDCQRVYQQQLVSLQDSQFCAGGEKNVDSCSGDSGGPLMGVDTKRGNRPFFYVAGLVSLGPDECGKVGWPGVYTRVGSYIDWIQRKIRP